MGQHTSEFHQEQLGVVNERVLENLSASTASIVVPPAAEFGGHEPFVDEDVIARFLQVEPREVLEMARAGEIPAHPLRRGKRHRWRFRISEVADAMSRRVAPSGATLRMAVPGATRRKQ